jgi:hypothetical protein
MSKTISIDLLPDGSIEGIEGEVLHKIAAATGAEVTKSCRASNVEWEDHTDHSGADHWCAKGKGLTVRSAHNPDLAIRSRPMSIAEREDKRFFEYIDSCMGPAPIGHDRLKNPEGRTHVLSLDPGQPLVLFESRDEAIRWELHFFNAIMDARRKYEAIRLNGKDSEGATREDPGQLPVPVPPKP